MCLGVGWSGLPIPKSMMSSPRARALAFRSLTMVKTYGGRRLMRSNSSIRLLCSGLSLCGPGSMAQGQAYSVELEIPTPVQRPRTPIAAVQRLQERCDILRRCTSLSTTLDPRLLTATIDVWRYCTPTLSALRMRRCANMGAPERLGRSSVPAPHAEARAAKSCIVLGHLSSVHDRSQPFSPPSHLPLSLALARNGTRI
jgi:hypothetical protein